MGKVIRNFPTITESFCNLSQNVLFLVLVLGKVLSVTKNLCTYVFPSMLASYSADQNAAQRGHQTSVVYVTPHR